MKKLIAVILLGSVLLSTGCGQSLRWNVSYDSKIIGDGAGGTIVLYDVSKNYSSGDFYVQRLSSDGYTLWGEKGVLIGSGDTRTSSINHLKIASDNHSGVIITRAYHTTDQKTYVYQITRVNSEGRILWQKGIKGVDEVTGDGNGGAITAAADGSALFAIKIDSQGRLPWGEDGISINHQGYQNNTLQLISDGAGGAIVIWGKESSYQPGTTGSIFGQRVDSEGNLLWEREGTLIYSAAENATVTGHCMTNDGSGGAIVAWRQWAYKTIQDNSKEVDLNGMYVQKLDASGNILWQPDGVPIETTKVSGPPPLMVGDGLGGAIITFTKLTSLTDGLYAQKIDSDGKIKWQPGGVKVFDIKRGMAFSLQMVGDELGNAVISFAFHQDEIGQQGVQVQKLDPDGKTIWSTDEVVPVGNGILVHPFLSSDSKGGVFIAVDIRKDESSSSKKSYVQRINSSGNVLWGKEGIRLGP